MGVTPARPPLLPAAYCVHSNTVFTYELRDLFNGELFCPRCSSRTNPADRAPTMAALRRLFPGAVLYVPSPPLIQAQTRPR